MLKLILMRHSIALPLSVNIEDFDRKLSAEGREKCQNVGKFFKENNLVPNQILVSSANRTMQTVEELNKILNVSESSITSIIELYNANPEEILNIVAQQPDLFKTILLVSHNPSISQLANILANSNDSFYFNPAGFAVLTLNISSWREISANSTKLSYLQI